jgi:hypothetical protein
MNVAQLCARCSKRSTFQSQGYNQLVVSEINLVGQEQHYFQLNKIKQERIEKKMECSAC